MDYDSEDELALWQEFVEIELEPQEIACAAIIMHGIEEAWQDSKPVNNVHPHDKNTY